MNDLDELLRHSWQQQQPRSDAALLSARVERHRRRHRRRRMLEIALTLAAVALLPAMLFSDDSALEYWLLLPFFAVYLPTTWLLLLRAPRARAGDATRDGRSYAQLRLSQLRSGLRDMWMARIAAWALLAYAASATCLAWMFADSRWHDAALRLLVYALAWAAATRWLSRRRRRAGLREYRSLRRLIEPAGR